MIAITVDHIGTLFYNEINTFAAGKKKNETHYSTNVLKAPPQILRALSKNNYALDMVVLEVCSNGIRMLLSDLVQALLYA